MTPQTLAALIVAALCFAAGWSVEGWRKNAEIARLEAVHSAQRARDAEAANADIAAAQARGDALVARVAMAENARTQVTQEKTDAIRRLTAGRPCLDRAAVGVLNGAPRPAAVPATAGQPAATDAAFATDTDVGLWIGEAQRTYDTCRGRLDAVADFYAPKEVPLGDKETP